MNFFQHQQLARRNSRVMVLLFALSVVAIVVAVDLVAAAVYMVAQDEPEASLAAVAALFAGTIDKLTVKVGPVQLTAAQ